MTAMFDTLKFARALRDGGQFTPEQAERLSDALSDAISGEVVARSDLAATESKLGRKIDDVRTELKTDIESLRVELKTDIADLRAELKADIADLRAELKADIADLRAELKADIRGLEIKIEAGKADTIKWVVGIIGFQTIAIVGAAVVLGRLLAH